MADDFETHLGEVPDYLSDAEAMRAEKYDYDAMLDSAYEYETEVIEKGIRAQAEERARAYLSQNGDAVWARIEGALSDSKRLIGVHPGASLVLSMTAAELTVRFMLLRPLLAGLVIDPALADHLAAEATQGLAGRDRDLLPRVFRAWGIDLIGRKIGKTRDLWPTYGEMWNVRHGLVHRGDVATLPQAELAFACSNAFVDPLLVTVTRTLVIDWPVARWLQLFDVPKDPLAMSAQRERPGSRSVRPDRDPAMLDRT